MPWIRGDRGARTGHKTRMRGPETAETERAVAKRTENKLVGRSWKSAKIKDG